MFGQLESLEGKRTTLEEKLSDPVVVGDPKRYRELAREHAQVSRLHDLYLQYKKVEKEIEQNRELLREDDEEMVELAKGELETLNERLEQFERDIRILLLPKDPNDDKNILLEIRAGTGGDEAALFVADLFRMYSRYAEDQGWKVEVMSSNPTGIGGFKEIIGLISGDQVYSRLKYESGVHRVQRVPETEAQGRIHTSAVTVAVLPEADEVEVQIDPTELRIDTYRASGAGGQHVNKTESAIRITHLPTGLVVTCQDEKSQHKNRAKALKVLQARLFDLKQQQQHDQMSADRKNQVGSGDRSERIRTYNFPQGRVSDHRINLTLYRLEDVMLGRLDDLLLPLITHFQTKALQKLQ